MMFHSKVVTGAFLLFYAVLLYFTFNNDMQSQMIAMRMMAVGMFLEAFLGFITAVKSKNHK